MGVHLSSKSDHRQAEILEIVRANGYTTTEDLAGYFSVTPQTIRRDINTLCDHGLVKRRHGGVAPAVLGQNTAYGARQVLNLDEKRVIAEKVARQVPDGASLAFSIGTTPEMVARALANHRSLRIFTNNMNVAEVACANDSFEVTLTGGRLRNRDRDVLGPTVERFFAAYKVDFGIYGVGGIDADGTLLDFHEDEVRAREAIRHNCRQAFLVADHTKFGRNAVVKGGHITDAAALFTDRPVPGDLGMRLRAGEVSCHDGGAFD